MEWLMVCVCYRNIDAYIRCHIPVSAIIGTVGFQATGAVLAIHAIHCILCLFRICGSAYTTLLTLNVFDAWLYLRTHVFQRVDGRVELQLTMELAIHIPPRFTIEEVQLSSSTGLNEGSHVYCVSGSLPFTRATTPAKKLKWSKRLIL